MSTGPIRLVAAPGRPLEVFIGDERVELRPKERVVVAALALRHPETVTIDLLIAMVWPADQPSTAQQSIHNHLARLRKVAPGIVQSTSAGYRLAPDVEIVVTGADDDDDGPRDPSVGPRDPSVDPRDHSVGPRDPSVDSRDPDDVLVEFADVPAMRPARTAFARRHRALDETDAVDLIRAGQAAAVLADSRRDVLHDPLDERAWWTLAVSTAAVDGVAAAAEVVDGARAALLDVGLEPGRRLLDLDRMIRDGVVSPSVLLVDPFGSDVGNRLGELEAAVEVPLDTVRSILTTGEPVVIQIDGSDGFLRRELLSRLVDDARATGFATRTVRVQDGDVGPPTARSVHVGIRPVVTVIDGGEYCTKVDELVAVLTNTADSGDPGPWVVTSDHAFDGRADDGTDGASDDRSDDGAASESSGRSGTRDDVRSDDRSAEGSGGTSDGRTDGAPDIRSGEGNVGRSDGGSDVRSDGQPEIGESVAAALAIDGRPLPVQRVSIPSGTTHFDELQTPSGTGVRRLVAILALIGEAVRLDAIAPLVGSDTSAAALHAARSGLVRIDAATHLVDLASPHVGRMTLDAIDDAERTLLLQGLAELHDEDHDEPRRQTRRAGFALAAFGPAAAATIDATRSAARLHADRGDFAAAAAVLDRTSVALESEHGRTPTWCALEIEAGQARLAGGDPSGDAALRTVIEFATSTGEVGLAAAATLEWCRLGTATGAGSVDHDRLDVIDRLLGVSTDPLERAQLGAAAAMVLSFADRPDVLRRHFVDAVDHATASADLDVLADVLPNAYMSLPLHDDIDERLAHGERLIALSDELDRPDARWEGLQLVYSSQLMRGDPAFRDSFDALERVEVHERSRNWEMHYIRSNIAIVDGDIDAARGYVDASLAFSADIHEERVAAVFGVHHLVAAMIDGDAGSFLEPIRTLATEQPGVGAWQAALAVCAASAGDTTTALDAVRRTIGEGSPNLRRDPTYSAGLVALGEAIVILGDEQLAATMLEHLEPLAGSWSWCGSCTFGPIDLTRARLARVAGRLDDAEAIASSAIENCAAMRAPLFADAATGLLLDVLAAR